MSSSTHERQSTSTWTRSCLVERRDNPDLRGKPVAIGGKRERGVVALFRTRPTARSALGGPSVSARRKGPDLIFVKLRFDVYKAVSEQIRTKLAEYTPLIEPLSLDEACLEVTENLKGIASAAQISRRSEQGSGPRRVWCSEASCHSCG